MARAPLRMPGRDDKVLAPVSVDRQTEAMYRRKLERAVALMAASYLRSIERKYGRALEANVDTGRLPDIAQDASAQAPGAASSDMFDEMKRLRDYWQRYFDTFAREVTTGAFEDLYVDNQRMWQSRLRNAGFDIKLDMTPSQRLVMKAKVQENVALIRSISQEYHTAVEGEVLRHFIAGRDLKGLQDKLVERGKVTTNRAAFIARDQCNKATAQFNSARQRELGLHWATWQHSSAGKEPRPNHVRAGREKWIFNTQVGIDFGDKFGSVLPGEAINCRCSSRTIIPGMGRTPGGREFDPGALGEITGFPGAYREAA
ncbi:gp17 [Burkholderia phage Bcep1]|uniref:Gp17 n=1 Tax=Burkholderia phage Bcep1 TaxID=2883943 RepID=Q6UJ15_9CAUD|nr:head morphogenesis [Burkholderia phage Bcep1]AAQ73363.1 gp17 [Burkholderia phage Bcep1]